MVYPYWFIKIELYRGSHMSSWPPLRQWFLCIPWGCLPWIWGAWYELPWRVLPWKWITYGIWDCIWSMSKVFISWIVGPPLLLNWDFGVPLGFSMSSSSQRFCIQSLISKVRDTLLIIIYNLEGLKGDQFRPNWRFFILYYMKSIKIFIKHQMKLRSIVASF